MPRRLLKAVLPTLLILEAVLAALWISNLLPSLPGRFMVTILLVGLRASVSAGQFVGGWLLRIGRPLGSTLARATLAASAGLMVFETGLRLVPSNMDPTFRWWAVGGYWVYAGVAIWAIGSSGHRTIGSSGHRTIGSSDHRTIGSSDDERQLRTTVASAGRRAVFTPDDGDQPISTIFPMTSPDSSRR